ncbi:potassium channel family protein [Lutibaculum baratangense]|uniref:TrkA n=1 Tax=Lutibaculum baratangense AMV1 TaxID=631454 RepID=V4TI61_9HYPH|nr:TrkA family potassium uptake protein [Lutibaculum baratangense]ESR25693.1 TrkA [Lutibaculum baratangense AMV1]
MSRKKRAFAVIGLGTFGRQVATQLADLGNEVLGIDIDERKVNPIADRLDQAVIADARDEQALKEAGLGDCDVALVAIGEDLEANILCTMTAQILGVPEVWVKAMNKMHHRILHRIGATRVIHPESEIGTHVAHMLHTPYMVDYVSLGNRSLVAIVSVPEALQGQGVTDLDLEGYDIRCLGMVRGSDFVPCNGEADLAFRPGDRMLLLGRRDGLQRFATDLMDAG